MTTSASPGTGSRTGHENPRIVGQNGGVRGIDPHVGLRRMSLSPETSICSAVPGLNGTLARDAEDGVKVRRIRRSDVDGNDYRAINLATGNLEPSRQRDRRHPAHTSKTHRHPEEEVVVSND